MYIDLSSINRQLQNWGRIVLHLLGFVVTRNRMILVMQDLAYGYIWKKQQLAGTREYSCNLSLWRQEPRQSHPGLPRRFQ